MNIHEHQAKQILKKYGAVIPEGIFAFTVDELIEKAKLSADNMNDGEKIEKFKNLFIENIKLKRKIRVLEEQLFKYKFQLNKSSLQV